MAEKATVFICGSAIKAAEAAEFLRQRGFSRILLEENVETFLFDAETFDGGGSTARHMDQWVVIGRR